MVKDDRDRDWQAGQITELEPKLLVALSVMPDGTGTGFTWDSVKKVLADTHPTPTHVIV